jgi:hypothetical protein
VSRNLLVNNPFSNKINCSGEMFMKNIDDFLNAVRERSDWNTDYKIGKGLGYSNTTQVSGWRRRVAMPNIDDIIAMCDHAKLDIGDAARAVSYSKNHEKPVKQTGFSDIALLLAMSAGSFGAMSLDAVTPLSYASIGAVLLSGGYLSIHYAK